MEHECQCTGAGWCERHQVHKSEHMVRLCQQRGAYWEAWEKGTGLEQVRLGKVAPRPVTKKANQDGWGDNITTWLKKIGITEDSYKDIKVKFGLPPTCNCAKRREWLNSVGRWWNGEE